MQPEPVIHAADERTWIDRVLKHYGLSPDSLTVVPSVFDWCLEHGYVEDNVGRMAKCLCDWDKGECLIVMRESFTQSAFDSANFTMQYRGFVDEVDALKTPKLNLLHLLLHEVACHTLRTTEQELRDKWAFAEMSKHET
jgi:hypothetical protein